MESKVKYTVNGIRMTVDAAVNRQPSTVNRQ